jgi:hypothetical protein
MGEPCSSNGRKIYGFKISVVKLIEGHFFGRFERFNYPEMTRDNL